MSTYETKFVNGQYIWINTFETVLYHLLNSGVQNNTSDTTPALIEKAADCADKAYARYMNEEE